jgi:hypothetical protein
MDTFVVQSMVWGRILLTILSKFGSQVLSRVGVPSEFSSDNLSCKAEMNIRCDANRKDLDAPGARPRSHAKTDHFIKVFDPGTLWSEYGIRYDVVVSSSQTNIASSGAHCSDSRSRMDSQGQISTNYFAPIFSTSLSRAHSRITMSLG